MSGSNIIPFNPLDTKNLGASVAEAMLEQVAQPLGSIRDFPGAGIYAIYYVGPFSAYLPLSQRNINGAFHAPIYVGKAVPAGARKGGGVGLTGGRPLYLRLKEHADSIAAAKSTLNLEDFYCRFLVVEDIWIPLAESLLIAKFAPVWNSLIDGFGNHDPGSGRYNGLRPKWDVLHPGRRWADKCAVRTETSSQIEAQVVDYFRSIAFPASYHLLGPA